ncbi:7-carboxy-7-deazaguanine synthase [Pelagimonas phthalicica]|uniref:7-carboxy-7-deazaguanine synthase n=1 Tax=Pelagimonas phthalicica TaxID=1037362 RepID=A0A238JEX5_9RHOB|nr:7-carboxy-7-deazaguanine synthase QueE [Pelagimonas phthalicica]TDS92169.1 preQ(0) biosynthesis protein QueE [Pelagimonas phthalicica]SMX29230.1 7-carboxy-7-deazaguanine synthase [Pelagimonas phthalicica]
MTLRIAEIFGPTIQGEGALIGEPTVFVRTGGCDYRCSWCDSLHAVDSAHRHDWHPMSAEAVWDEVERLSGGTPLTVSLSGGNPAIQDFTQVMALGQSKGYRFACETQGSIAKPWFGALETLVLSPKPPSSGETVDWADFEDCIAATGAKTQVVMKIVIFDANDYDWARAAAGRYPDLPLYLQPGNPDVDPDLPIKTQDSLDRMLWLVEKVTSDGWFTPRILPQLHVLLWGNKRGV